MPSCTGVETPLRRQRKVDGSRAGLREGKKHLCVGREKRAAQDITQANKETPLRRQRKAPEEKEARFAAGNTSA